MIEGAVADHGFLDGRLVLREPCRGHRSGTDAILLAAVSRVQPGEHVLDVGAGAGAVALTVLRRVADATATLVEKNPVMAALARHNVQANGFADRANVVEGDIFDVETWRCLKGLRPDVIASNPPFYLRDEVRPSPDPQRVSSHILPDGHHGDWMTQLLRLASPKTRICLVHRPDALPTLAEACLGRASLRLTCVHTRVSQPAKRILIEAKVGSRSPLKIEAPVALHDDRGLFTTLAEELHRGCRDL